MTYSQRWPIGRMLAGMAIMICLYAMTTRGGVGEFSPDTLEYRTQLEITLFWGSFPVYRSPPEVHENEVLQFIQQVGYVAPVKAANPRWELVFHWNQAWQDGERDGYRTLIRSRQSTLGWSQNNPELARYFWSECFRLLRSSDPVEQLAGQVLIGSPMRYKGRQELDEFLVGVFDFAKSKVEQRRQ